MNIYELVKKLSIMTKENPFNDKNEFIDKCLSNIYIEKISAKNKKDIKDRNITIVEKVTNDKKLDFLYKKYSNLSDKLIFFGIFPSITFFALGTFPFIFQINKEIPIENYFSICYTLCSLFSISWLRFSYLRKKIDKMIDKEIESVNHIVGTTTNDYMTETYKKHVRELSLDLISECESIKEVEFQDSKKYLIDYLIIKTFEFEKSDNYNFIDGVSEKVEKNIFVTNQLLSSKKIQYKEEKFENNNEYLLLTTQQMKEELLKLN